MTRGITDKLVDPRTLPAQPVDVGAALARNEARLRQRPGLRLGVAADRLGAELGRPLVTYLEGLGLEMLTSLPGRGQQTPRRSYVDWGAPVLTALQRGEIDRALLICGNGRGMLKLARAWPGARPHLAELLGEVEASRRHSDSNVLCLGARAVGRRVLVVRLLVTAWLATESRPSARYQQTSREIEAAVARPRSLSASILELGPAALRGLARLGAGRGISSLLRAPVGRLDDEVLCDQPFLLSRGYSALRASDGEPLTSPPRNPGRSAVLTQLDDAALRAAPALRRPAQRSHRLPPRWLIAWTPPGRGDLLARRLAQSHLPTAMQPVDGGELHLFDRVPTYPRTPYLAGSAVGTGDDLVLSSAESSALLARPHTVEEKLDGFNLGIWFQGGQLHLCEMDGAVRGDEHPALLELKLWVERRRAALSRCLGERYVLYVEALNLRHAVEYQRLPDIALGFDVLDRERGRFLASARARALVGGAGVRWVPQLRRGAALSARALEQLIGSSRLGAAQMEGLVLRDETGGWCRGRAKLVHTRFELAEHPWQWARDERNRRPAPPRRQRRATAPGSRSKPDRQWLTRWRRHLEDCDYPTEAQTTLAETTWQRRLARRDGALFIGRRGTSLVGLRLRTGGASTLRPAWQALALLHRAGVGPRPLAYDPQPPGPAEAYLFSCEHGELLDLRRARSEPLELAQLLRRAQPAEARVRWIYDDFPSRRDEVTRALRRLVDAVEASPAGERRWREISAADLMDTRPAAIDRAPRALCPGGWSEAMFTRSEAGLLLLEPMAPTIGDPAHDAATLLHAARISAEAEERFVAAYAEAAPGGAAACVERLAFYRSLHELTGSQRVRDRGDATRALIGRRIFALALPAADQLRNARSARLSDPGSRGGLTGAPLAAAPTVVVRTRRGARLELVAGSACGRRTVEEAWTLAREAGALPPGLDQLEQRWRLQGPLHEQLASSLRRSLEKAVRRLVPTPVCLVAWPEGVLSFLRLQALAAAGLEYAWLSRLYADLAVLRFQIGQERMFDVERVRLRAAGIDPNLLAHVDAQVPTQLRTAGDLRGVNLQHPFPHTLLSFPWGRDAACALGRALVASGVRSIFFVGGCGALSGRADVEDIFVPTRVATNDAPSIALGQAGLSRGLHTVVTRRGGTSAVRRGALFNVDTVLEEDDAMLRGLRRRGFGAVEMECYGLALAAGEAGVDFGCALDVTDAPLRGKGYLFDLEARRAVSRRPLRARQLILEAFYQQAEAATKGTTR